jgi:hypothetical protein
MKTFRHLFSLLFANNEKKRMAEQAILDTIPDDWAADIDQRQLKTMALLSRPSVIHGIAEQLNIAPSKNLDELVKKIAKAHNVSLKRELDALEVTCINNAKIDLFTERYGHLFNADKNGDLSHSIPMLRKITGMSLPG